MFSSNRFVGFLRAFSLLVLIMTIIIPLRYGSTNQRYLLIRVAHSLLTVKHFLVPDTTRPTLSAEYRAFENLIRLRPIREHNSSTNSTVIIKALRAERSLDEVVPKPSHCQILKEVFVHNDHTVDTYWIDHSAGKFQKHIDKLLIFLHGGGYLLGNIHGYSGIECELSRIFNAGILHVEYRLSPEHPLPAAVDDTVVIYRALLAQNISPSQILIFGDSAGGGLVLLAVQAFLIEQLPVPRAVVALSPWTDLSTSGESYTRNDGIDLIFTYNDVRWVASQILDVNQSQLSLSNPLYSPLFGSFRDFPPMYITVGTAEIMYDDAKGVFEKAHGADVDVTLEEGPHMMHVYPLFFSFFPEAKNTMDNINKWVQARFEAN